MQRFSLIASLIAVFMLASLTTLTPTADARATSAVSLSKKGKKDETRLRARARGQDGKIKAEYRERTKKGTTARRFQVQIERATPGAELPVALNGDVIGVLRVNALGRGKFARRTVTDDPGKQGPVPQLAEGDVVTVGSARATFRRKR